eukprot:CAMPEP_0117656444 /NCGR_PEP_ID=MMETSP0804-20121206/4808_1 /TAXON_ID=1074897 /ORGANISM="Tetraselmis astigmatica, Strain CCMP880" /LENGTH=218 /DNA_ID=CAMNT_0005462847 /DNA_START=295 /DNA_END=951 /DNA_ORIENTATION=-
MAAIGFFGTGSAPGANRGYNQKEDFNGGMPNPADFSPQQKEMFLRFVRNGKRYFEFGGGYSTKIVLQETDMLSVNTIEDSQYVMDAIREPDYRARQNSIHIDLGEFDSWGVPVKPYSKMLSWPTYSAAIAGYRDANVVFVNGRFRVASICAALLYTDPDHTVILVHDWVRNYYHLVYKFVYALETSEDGLLVALKAKEDIDENEVLRMYEDYKYHPTY